jgi:hypothetical protein
MWVYGGGGGVEKKGANSKKICACGGHWDDAFPSFVASVTCASWYYAQGLGTDRGQLLSVLHGPLGSYL